MLKKQVHGHDRNRSDDRLRKHTTTAQTTDSGSAPDRGSRSQPPHCIAGLEDNTGAEEANAGYNLRDDSRVITTHYRRRHQYIECAADGDERYSACTNHFAMPLPLQADEIAQRHGQHNLREQLYPIGFKKSSHTILVKFAAKVLLLFDIRKQKRTQKLTLRKKMPQFLDSA